MGASQALKSSGRLQHIFDSTNNTIFFFYDQVGYQNRFSKRERYQAPYKTGWSLYTYFFNVIVYFFYMLVYTFIIH